MPAIIKADPYKRYKVVKLLFQTALIAKCVVYRRDTAEDGTYVMAVAPLNDKTGVPNGIREHVLNLLDLDHPGLVKVFEAYEYEGYCYAIMSDWTLHKHGSFGLTTLTEEQVARSIHKMTSALLHLHQNGVILGNVSFEEMRFTRHYEDDGNDQVEILIIDLAMSRYVDPIRYVELHQDRRYANPPEARDGSFTEFSDVWTLGSTTFYLLTGDVSREHLLERIEFDIEAKLENVSPEARNFCLACLKVIPEERMPLAEAMVHPWFKKMDVQEMGRQKIRHSFADVKRSVVPTNKNFLKRACLIVAKHVDEDLLDEHQQMFDEIDVDRNGYITHEEFFQALKVNSKVTDDLISDFLDLDLDRSGTISFNEFVAAVLLYTDRIDDNTLIKTFHHMDPSGTGFISVSDLCHVMEDVTADEAREMLYEAIGHREMAEPILTQKQFMNAFRTKNKSTFNTWLSRIVNG